jgi:hypothetical protein
MGYGLEALHSMPDNSEIISLPLAACITSKQIREYDTPFDKELHDSCKAHIDKEFEHIDLSVFYNRHFDHYCTLFPFMSMVREKKNKPWVDVMPFSDLTNLVMIPKETWIDVISNGLIDNYKIYGYQIITAYNNIIGGVKGLKVSQEEFLHNYYMVNSRHIVVNNENTSCMSADH